MLLRPFLSHKRQEQSPVFRLRDELRLRGIGGWKDTEDLPVGEQTRAGIRRAILRDTGGFLWWGTPAVLGSEMVNTLEIPTALERTQTDPTYPVVPLFAGLRPGTDADRIANALGEKIGRRFLDQNGVVREVGESDADFVRRAARRYARDAVRALDGSPPAANFTAFKEPDPSASLTFDWRAVFDSETRRLDPEALPILIESLQDAREALQSRVRQPQVTLDLDLPLPLAYLVGYQWRITIRMNLSFLQRTGAHLSIVDGDGPLEYPAEPASANDLSGPIVVAVSTPWRSRGAADRYASSIGAGNLVEIAVDRILEPMELRGLARTVADLLKQLGDLGVEKHLLIRGPSTLAALVGAGSNAIGPVVLPFWDGERYVSPIIVGELAGPRVPARL